MKKIILTALVLISGLTAQAQNRKHAASFSLFQQYYNPALTGFQGSAIKSYYRNQWAGFDGAPKTMFLSGEANLADFRNGASVASGEGTVKAGIDHSAGLYIIHDTYGPFMETEVTASYRSLIHLTRQLSLHAGAAIGYHAQRLDGDKLSTEEAGDPSMLPFLDEDNSQRVDFNIGLALSGEDFYVGYGMQNLRGGAGSEQDYFRNNSKLHYMIQGGYRRPVSDQVGLIFNGLFRYDNQLQETIEGQVKGVFYNTAWLGVGYRHSLAYNFNIGFRFNQFRVGYAYEVPTGDAHRVGSTNEITLSCDLRKVVFEKLTRTMSMW